MAVRLQGLLNGHSRKETRMKKKQPSTKRQSPPRRRAARVRILTMDDLRTIAAGQCLVREDGGRTVCD
jgi:hypothetical protein